MSRRVNLADMLDGEPLDEPTHAAPRPPVLNVAQIAHNPDNPRGEIDETDQEFLDLATSVENVGVITPLTVCTATAFLRHNPQHADRIAGYQYVVVAGHRRLEAARRAGLAEVPAFVNENAAEDPLVWAVAENLLRVGLTPIQEAHTLRVLTDKPPAGRGMSQSKVAKGIGKTQAFVSFRIALLGLVPELQAKVASGELGVKAARAYTSLPAEEQLGAYEAALVKPTAAPVPAAKEAAAPASAGKNVPANPPPAADPAQRPADAAPVPPAPRPESPASGPVGSRTPAHQETAVAVADAADVPEPRAPHAEPASVPDVDWHDIDAFARAVRSVLDKTEVYELAEALIDSLRD
ncbi:ParB/RepB/Spo0J family partition protein [Kitasatospora sp. NPDC058444]|uniref:ParB/RepB/Spo0J family partition protein n=1 Tax=Kitasatospora sp. NPDC058444 TaxID=3346504 RepID=UPI0036578CB2